MADYAERMMVDLPDQFKGKERINALIAAIGRQLDEVYDFFNELNTERSLPLAEGVQLDMIGSIVGLTRKEAYSLLQTSEDELTDELYRTALQYKILLNSNNCTYYDFMTGLALVWSGYTVTYGETPEYPATILLTFPDMGIDDSEDHSAARKLSIKPAGVKIKWTSGYLIQVDESELEAIILAGVWIKIAIPFWDCDMFDGSFLLDGSHLLGAVRILSTVTNIGFSATADSSEMEAYGNMTLTTKSADCWFLDGAVMLDGSRSLGSTYKKEDIE